MNTKEEVLQQIERKYEEALNTEPTIALAHRMFCTGEVSQVEALKIAIVALVEVKEALAKQMSKCFTPFIIESPASSEHVQIMETMKDQLVQSMGIPISLMNADGHTYSGSKIAYDAFYKSDKDKYKGTGEYRPPKKGEFYFSSMSLRIEQAQFDFESEQHIYTLKEPHAKRTNK